MRAARRPIETAGLLTASLLGAGRSPVVPGTVGTLASLPLAVAAAYLLPLWGYLAVTAAVIAVAIWSAGVAARVLGAHDPGFVVIDETAGLFVTLIGLPVTPWMIAGGFFMFRMFDVLKPPPAARAERLPGGTGIVLDDLIAGAYANLALRAADLLLQRLTV